MAPTLSIKQDIAFARIHIVMTLSNTNPTVSLHSENGTQDISSACTGGFSLQPSKTNRKTYIFVWIVLCAHNNDNTVVLTKANTRARSKGKENKERRKTRHRHTHIMYVYKVCRAYKGCRL